MKKYCLFILAVLFLMPFVFAADFGNSYTYSNPSNTPADFKTYYSASELDSYWPQLNQGQDCKARQDLILQVAPAGCQPTVVRSDLIAEQNVPVFCQIDALKVNPLIDINSIKSISFSGNYPSEVVGTGFHPARAALRTQNSLLGSPLLNNIGYVVVVLKKQPNEKDLPDKVNLTLTAKIQYDSRNALGVGKASYLLEPMSDEQWVANKGYYSFWQGRYFVRLVDVNEQGASINLYEGDRLMTSVRVRPGESSQPIYFAGSYCSAGVQIAFDGFKQATDKAVIEVTDEKGTERLELYNGQSFLNDKCRITGLIVNNTDSGKVQARCSSSTTTGRSFTLELKAKYDDALVDVNGEKAKVEVLDGGIVNAQFSGLGAEYQLNSEGNLVLLKQGDLRDIIGIEKILENSNKISWPTKDIKTYNNAKEKVRQDAELKNWLIRLQKALVQYRGDYLKNPEGDLISAEKAWNRDIEGNFSGAVESYKEVANDYTGEKNLGQVIGEGALVKAIELARAFSKDGTRRTLINAFISLYPGSSLASSMKFELEQSYRQDSSGSTMLVNIDNSVKSIKLVSLSRPEKLASAEFSLGNNPATFKINYKESKRDFAGLNVLQGTNPIISVERIEGEGVYVSGSCTMPSSQRDNSAYGVSRISQYYGAGETFNLCGNIFTVKGMDSNELASIRVLPIVQGSGSEVNLSVAIGIEKRAIKLSPEKTEEMINNLNESIKKWESISNSLGNVVKGMKAACFATSAILSFKNFMTGLSGETIARQKAMEGAQGWTAKCKAELAKPDSTYNSMDDCFLKNSEKISKDVDAWKSAIEQTNEKVKSIEGEFTKQTDSFGGLISGDKVVDQDKAKQKLIEEIKKSDCGSQKVKIGNEEKKISDLLSPSNSENGKDPLGYVSYKELVDLYSSCIAKGKGVDANSIDAEIKKKAESVQNQINLFNEANKDVKSGEPRAVFVNAGGVVGENTNLFLDVVKPSGLPNSGVKTALKDYEGAAKVTINGNAQGKDSVSVNSGNYYLGLKAVQGENGRYNIEKIVDSSGQEVKNGNGENLKLQDILTSYKLNLPVKAISSINLNNKYSNPEVRFYETEPYKGMPAVVPVDKNTGFYAGTKQILPVGGGIGAFDSSGRVTSFWLCNVGSNGLEEFEKGLGDDICMQVNTNTGQANTFPGLSAQQASAYIEKAKQAIMSAAQQYANGVRVINVQGFGAVNVGSPAINSPQTQCQDFMSPEDCHLMFNVCDPVICPNSRCNLGGAYPVADVVQTGIVGSVLLCLPNVKEGIFIPVCLTGIKAGIDSYVSILKNHRDCLQTSLNTGQMVGICDQIYSIYLCEFFWRQLAPVANILLPKLIESAYGGGQGARGGGEYLTTMAAWQNMQKSIDYFTQSYAVNSFKAFQVRSTEEAGSMFCKASISGKLPTSFDTLLEPDSPSQLYAWFSSTTYSTATLPATAQYKVFYHIFAGNDAGVYYSVYLKNPPVTSYYTTSPTVQVASGFIAKGQYASETKDFTAPEGYKELCVRVNEKENCGFKQVSTDFAVNYVRDKVVQGEIENKDINSDNACVSGEPSASGAVGSVLTNTNPGAALDEAANPKIYNRGVVRICSTQNPGLSTEPSRYTRVGSCSDPKVSCWLDSKSVDNAITANNIGVKNETLKNIEEQQVKQLQEDGQLMKVEDAGYEIKRIRDSLEGLNDKDLLTYYPSIISRIEQIESMVYMNNQKAMLIDLKGDVYAKVARQLLLGYQSSVLSKSTANSQSPNNVDSVTQADSDVIQDKKLISDYSLQYPGLVGNDYNLPILAKKVISSSGEFTNFYVYQDRVYYISSQSGGTDIKSTSILVGTVNSAGTINFSDKASGIVADKDSAHLYSLNGKKIEGNKISV